MPAIAQTERPQIPALLDRRTGPTEMKTPMQGREVDLQTPQFCKRYGPDMRTYLSDSGSIFQVSQAIFRLIREPRASVFSCFGRGWKL